MAFYLIARPQPWLRGMMAENYRLAAPTSFHYGCMIPQVTVGTMKQAQNFETIAKNYSHFIVDLWGVVHDGEFLYPGVVEILQQLHADGKQVVFLSNAPRRSAIVEEKLNELGITPELYTEVNTSGETAYRWMQKQAEQMFGNKIYFLGQDKDVHLINPARFDRVEEISEADFILVAAFERFHQPMKEVQHVLAGGAAKGIPLLCANPDRMVVKQDGERIECAGLIADAYKKLGGQVRYFGKPYPAVYSRTLELLGDPDKSAVLAIGDALETDIKGASKDGIDSLWLTGGIHKQAVMPDDETIDEDACGALYAEHECVPTYRLSRWAS